MNGSNKMEEERITADDARSISRRVDSSPSPVFTLEYIDSYAELLAESQLDFELQNLELAAELGCDGHFVYVGKSNIRDLDARDVIIPLTTFKLKEKLEALEFSVEYTVKMKKNIIYYRLLVSW